MRGDFCRDSLAEDFPEREEQREPECEGEEVQDARAHVAVFVHFRHEVGSSDVEEVPRCEGEQEPYVDRPRRGARRVQPSFMSKKQSLLPSRSRT